MAELKEIAGGIARCQDCELCRTRRRTVPGQGLPTARIMFIGEAPGEKEDESGLPFQGRAGDYLKKLLKEVGFDPRNVYITNAVKCRPPENRRPTKHEINKCHLWLLSQIETLDPDVIVCVGLPAAMSVLNVKSTARMCDLRGAWGKFGRADVTCIYHPSHLMQHGRNFEKQTREDLEHVLDVARRKACRK